MDLFTTIGAGPDDDRRSSPYLLAHAVYHAAGRPYIPWTTVLDWHLQHGVVMGDSRIFLMARRVDWARPEEHALLVPHSAAAPGAWHIWAAAGEWPQILRVGLRHGARQVSFQRRDGRLHCWDFQRLLRRARARG